jgi:hypothetical protein
LLPDFVKPIGWWPPLIKACHRMQFSRFATRALSEQGSRFFPYFYYDLTDLPVDIDFVCGLKCTGQDAIMPDAGKTFW